MSKFSTPDSLLSKLQNQLKSLNGKQCSNSGTRQSARGSSSCSPPDNHGLDLQLIKKQESFLERLKQQREKVQQLKDQYESKCQQFQQKQYQLKKLISQQQELTSIRPRYQSVVKQVQKLGFQIQGEKKSLSQLKGTLTKIQQQGLSQVVQCNYIQIDKLSIQIQGLQLQKNRLQGLLSETKQIASQNQLKFKQQLQQLQTKWKQQLNQFEELKIKQKQARIQMNDVIKRLQSGNNQLKKIQQKTKLTKQQLQSIIQQTNQIQLLTLDSINKADKRANQLTRQGNQMQIQIERMNTSSQKQILLINQFHKLHKQNQNQTNLTKDQISKLQNLHKDLNVCLKKSKIKQQSLNDSCSRNLFQIKQLKQAIQQNRNYVNCLKEKQENQKKISDQIQRVRGQMARKRQQESARIDSIINR